MSSGKLELNTTVSANKSGESIALLNLLYSSINPEVPYSSGLKPFPRIKDDIYEFYHKAFEIHLLLLRNDNLSHKEKLNFCKIERNYIKLYLKAIMKKNYI